MYETLEINKEFYIKSKLTGMYLDKKKLLLLFEEAYLNIKTEKKSQIWRYTKEGYIENTDQGNVLDIWGNNSNNGAKPILYEKNGGNNQKWKYEYGQFISKLNEKVMEVKDNKVQMFESDDSDNQIFYIEYLEKKSNENEKLKIEINKLNQDNKNLDDLLLKYKNKLSNSSSSSSLKKN
jgi:hypothetical protein